MIPWILKNRITTALIVLVVVLVCWLGFVYGVAIPDAEKRGAAVATAKISQDFAVAQGRRVAETLEKERARTAEFATMQAKIEKERIHAKTVINSLTKYNIFVVFSIAQDDFTLWVYMGVYKLVKNKNVFIYI